MSQTRQVGDPARDAPESVVETKLVKLEIQPANAWGLS